MRIDKRGIYLALVCSVLFALVVLGQLALVKYQLNQERNRFEFFRTAAVELRSSQATRAEALEVLGEPDGQYSSDGEDVWAYDFYQDGFPKRTFVMRFDLATGRLKEAAFIVRN